MSAVTRLVTFVDVDGRPISGGISASARLDAELGDGRRVVLLDDRGWGESRDWNSATAPDLEEAARMVVGPDEPIDGRSHAEESAAHWAYLAGILHRQGVEVGPAELEKLPHDVEFSSRVIARVKS
ncbi:MAG TPA: hypothetical protein VHC49_23025 [Mycobacteriales bacterium]|nr:hypothetical protein [Mycobacteriales bacterium]